MTAAATPLPRLQERSPRPIRASCSSSSRATTDRRRRCRRDSTARDGAIVVSMDGDLQNDPRDIPLLVAKLEEGYDLVAGYRMNRQDKVVTRKIPSWVANRMIISAHGRAHSRQRLLAQGLPPRAARPAPSLLRHASLSSRARRGDGQRANRRGAGAASRRAVRREQVRALAHREVCSPICSRSG